MQTDRKRMMMVGALFFFSGFAALTYQQIWLRHLGLIFGNTVQAASTVITAYMLGLTLGAWAAGKWGHRFSRPVWAFGCMELLIGLYALVLPFAFVLLRNGYRWMYTDVSDSMPLLTGARFVLAMLLLLLPTVLMGATLPVLCRGLADKLETFGQNMGRLYAVNTLGAVLGLLMTGFVLLPALGVASTNGVALAINVAVGLGACLVGRNWRVEDEVQATVAPVSSEWRKAWVPLVGAGISGFLALALEVAWFRALLLVYGSTSYSFAAMLSVYLLGISLGAFAAARIADRMKHPLFGFAVVQAVAAVFVLGSLYGFNANAFLLLNMLNRLGFTWGVLLAAKFLITFIMVFVPTLCFGADFTFAAKAIRMFYTRSEKAVSAAYASDTIGAVGGSLVAGFVMIPMLGAEKTLVWLAFGGLGLTLFLLGFSKAIRWQRVALGGCVVLVVGAGWVHPPQWDQRILAAGPYFSPWNFISNGRVALMDQVRSERLMFFKEGLTSTVSTSKGLDENLYFSIDGKVETDTMARGMVVQRMIGHLPMLFHPNPKHVLNIGLGSGVTFGALGVHPVDTLEVVEIEPTVTNVVKAWSAYNHDVLSNPKAKIHIGDGRNYLFCTDKTYDVISSDPFEPVVGGSAALFTVDHFQAARDRLNTDGVMCQWVPMYEMSQQDFLTILRSFVHVFPDSALFFTGLDILMLGFNGDVHLDAGVLREHFEIPAVKASLAQVGFTSPEMILCMFVSEMSKGGGFIGPGPLNTDAHPVIEFSAPKSAVHYTPDQNQLILLENFTPIPATLYAGLSDEARHLIDRHHQALKLVLEASLLRAKEKPTESFNKLVQASQLAPDNPVVRNELVASVTASAINVMASGDAHMAYLQFNYVLRYDPYNFWAHYNLVSLCMSSGRTDEAMSHLNAGLEAYPDSPLFIALRGKVRASSGEDMKGALEDYRTALELLPERADLWAEYSHFLTEDGNFREALHAHKRAQELQQ